MLADYVQCDAGEVSLFDSSWGGGYTNDGNTNKCGRGWKVSVHGLRMNVVRCANPIQSFCCVASEFKDLTRGCMKAGWCDPFPSR